MPPLRFCQMDTRARWGRKRTGHAACAETHARYERKVPKMGLSYREEYTWTCGKLQALRVNGVEPSVQTSDPPIAWSMTKESVPPPPEERLARPDDGMHHVASEAARDGSERHLASDGTPSSIDMGTVRLAARLNTYNPIPAPLAFYQPRATLNRLIHLLRCVPKSVRKVCH